MAIRKHAAHPELVDMARMEDAAASASRSAEALFGYLSRLDALRGAGSDMSREALADRAANAELHMRVVLHAGLEALNELQDLGLIDHSLNTAMKDPDAFNKIKLTDALEQIGATFKERIPTGRWDWLATARHLVADVELRVEVHGSHLRGVVTHSGQSTVLPLVPGGRPRARVSTSAFFSAGSDRIYTPASAIFMTKDAVPSPKVAYDTAVGGMAFAREWVYRHARNASELGVPARSGAGPVLVVIGIVLIVVAALAAVAASILAFFCVGGSDTACRWAAYLGLAASVLSGKGDQVKATGQAQVMAYGTNPQ
jgi:hypothetical protein